MMNILPQSCIVSALDNRQLCSLSNPSTCLRHMTTFPEVDVDILPHFIGTELRDANAIASSHDYRALIVVMRHFRIRG